MHSTKIFCLIKSEGGCNFAHFVRTVTVHFIVHGPTMSRRPACLELMTHYQGYMHFLQIKAISSSSYFREKRPSSILINQSFKSKYRVGFYSWDKMQTVSITVFLSPSKRKWPIHVAFGGLNASQTNVVSLCGWLQVYMNMAFMWQQQVYFCYESKYLVIIWKMKGKLQQKLSHASLPWLLIWFWLPPKISERNERMMSWHMVSFCVCLVRQNGKDYYSENGYSRGDIFKAGTNKWKMRYISWPWSYYYFY